MINGQLKWKNGLSGFGFCPISLAAYAFAPPPGNIIYDILFVGTYGMLILFLNARSRKKTIYFFKFIFVVFTIVCKHASPCIFHPRIILLYPTKSLIFLFLFIG
jgi:hypothetical protein